MLKISMEGIYWKYLELLENIEKASQISSKNQLRLDNWLHNAHYCFVPHMSVGFFILETKFAIGV